MVPSMKFWDDWVDPIEDMQALWSNPDVHNEWTAAGEKRGQKVHMSRNPDGQPYVTQIEMRAMAEIIIMRHFKGGLDPAMICAIAEIESDRQPLAYNYKPKLEEGSIGLMQILQSTVAWLAKDMGYRAYAIDQESSMLHRPFVNVYFGAAYLRWLSTYDGKRRSEEFVVRSYNGGPNKASSHSSQGYWAKYLLAKQSLPMKSDFSLGEGKQGPLLRSVDKDAQEVLLPGKNRLYWDEKVSDEDMAEMWKHPKVMKQWNKAAVKRGNVHFARDSMLRPYITRTELKAVAEIIVSRHFSKQGVNSAMLCALAEISSGRLVHGYDPPNGIMQISFQTAQWLYSDLGCRSYDLKSVEDLSKPFVSMYFAAGYICWLSNYEGRQRSEQFIVQAYRSGPQAVSIQETGPFWLKYLEVLPYYDTKQQ
eukprot:c25054_g1_i1 orf=344-1603(-)